MKRIWMLGAALFLSANASTCGAQPAGEPGKAANPNAQDAQKAAVDKAIEEGRKNAEKAMAMTPAQRREWLLGIYEQAFRGLMTASGFADLEEQGQVWEFVRAQEAGRREVRVAASRLRDAVTNPKATDETLVALQKTYARAAEAERERRAGAVEELSALLKLDEKPRLRAFLLLNGVIGDAAWLTSDPGASLTVQAALLDPAEVAALK